MTNEQIKALVADAPAAAAELAARTRGTATDRLLLALAASAGVFTEEKPAAKTPATVKTPAA